MAFYQAVPTADTASDNDVVQHAQTARKKKPAEDIPEPKKRSALYKWWFGNHEEMDHQAAKDAAERAEKAKAAVADASVFGLIGGTAITSGTWAVKLGEMATGFGKIAASGPGAPIAAVVMGMMPGRLNDGEQDFIDRMRLEQMREAPSRVRYTWEQDAKGNPVPHGWHTPPGKDRVRVRKMEWVNSRKAYTFITEEDPRITIIWTPDNTGENKPWNTGNQNPVRIPNPVVVDPLPENTSIDTTTSPAPEEKKFADYILILPISDVPPIYIYLSENKTSFAHGYKHHSPKNKSWKEVIDSTKTGPAKFKQGADIASINHDVWETGTPTTNGQNWKVKEFDSVQGAYKGKETSWVVTKESQGTIHSHPIDADVARKLLK